VGRSDVQERATREGLRGGASNGGVSLLKERSERKEEEKRTMPCRTKRLKKDGKENKKNDEVNNKKEKIILTNTPNLGLVG